MHTGCGFLFPSGHAQSKISSGVAVLPPRNLSNRLSHGMGRHTDFATIFHVSMQYLRQTLIDSRDCHCRRTFPLCLLIPDLLRRIVQNVRAHLIKSRIKIILHKLFISSIVVPRRSFSDRKNAGKLNLRCTFYNRVIVTLTQGI